MRVGGGQVYLVDDREYLKVIVERKVGVRERLRLDALRCVHDQHRALARGERTADLVIEVDMTRSVDEVEGVVLPVGSPVVEADGARLDGYAALALKIHVVKDLILHLALLHRAAFFDETVGQRGLAVVDMCDYGKVAYVLLLYHSGRSSSENSARVWFARSITLCSWSRKALAACAVLKAMFDLSVLHSR